MKSLLRVALLVSVLVAVSLSVASARSVKVRGNRIYLDGNKGSVIYKSSGDLDGDGRKETAYAVVMDAYAGVEIVVARPSRNGLNYVDGTEAGYGYGTRADITDINGDHKMELVARMISGDGHWFCTIYTLAKGKLVTLADFEDTRFRDLNGDGIPEVLSVSMISFGFIGDHWLTIYKWNGHGYTDVSRRFPTEYDAVIRDLKNTIYELRNTKEYGTKLAVEENPEVYSDLYYYLGQAYEYRGLPEKAKTQYAIAYRLTPDDESVAKAFHRMWPEVTKSATLH